MTHYLESLHKGEVEFAYGGFNSKVIKENLELFFTHKRNQKDELWLYKVDNNKNTVGDTYIDTFVYRNGKVCKEVIKGNKTFYKAI